MIDAMLNTFTKAQARSPRILRQSFISSAKKNENEYTLTSKDETSSTVHTKKFKGIHFDKDEKNIGNSLGRIVTRLECRATRSVSYSPRRHTINKRSDLIKCNLVYQEYASPNSKTHLEKADNVRFSSLLQSQNGLCLEPDL